MQPLLLTVHELPHDSVVPTTRYVPPIDAFDIERDTVFVEPLVGVLWVIYTMELVQLNMTNYKNQYQHIPRYYLSIQTVI